MRGRVVFSLFVIAALVSTFLLGHALGERIDAASSGDPHAIAEGYVWAAQTVVNGMIFLGVYVLVFGRMSFGAVMPSLALGEAAYSASWFIGSVHARLLEEPIYTELFGHEMTGFVNPQYGMMVVFLGVLLALASSVAVSRFLPGYRFSRVAATLVMASMAFTGWFFHDQTVKSLDIADQGERKVLVSALSVDDFLVACRSAQVLCYEDPDINSEITGMDPVDEQLVGPLLYFAGKKFERSVHTLSGMGSSRDANARFFVAAIVVDGDTTRVGVSVHRPAERLDFERRRLSLQMLAAHLTWLFGGVFVSNLHRPRNRRKIRWPVWGYDPSSTSSDLATPDFEYSISKREFRQLPPELDTKVNACWQDFITCEETGKIEDAERAGVLAWNMLPEPRTEWDYFSNVIPFALAEFFRDNASFDQARSWLDVARSTYGPGPDQTVEFLAATIEFEAGNTEEAVKEFERQYRTFGDRPFAEGGDKYLELVERRVSA